MDIEQERKAFEAWFFKYHGYSSDTENVFADLATWEAWQARAKQTITLPVKDATGEH